MAFGGMVLGGALQGIGAGLMKQGEMDVLARRELALENAKTERALKQQTAADEAALVKQREGATAATALAKTQHEQGVERDEKRIRNEAVWGNWKGSEDDARDATQAVTLEEIKARNAKSQAEFESELRLNEDQQKGANEAYRTAEIKKKTVGGRLIDKHGSLVLYSETGNIISRSKPGLFVVPGQQADPYGAPTPAPSQSTSRAPAADAAPGWSITPVGK